MIVRKKAYGYSSQRQYIYGAGFIDTLRNVGSYVVQNKDLIAKPILGAVGNLAAAGLTEGGKALLNRLQQKSNKNKLTPVLDSKSQAILQNIINPSTDAGLQTAIPVSNIIGAGIKKV